MRGLSYLSAIIVGGTFIFVSFALPAHSQNNNQQGQSRATWWWCEPARAYYPTVTSCASPWRAIEASAANSQKVATHSTVAAPLDLRPALASPKSAGSKPVATTTNSIEAGQQPSLQSIRTSAVETTSSEVVSENSQQTEHRNIALVFVVVLVGAIFAVVILFLNMERRHKEKVRQSAISTVGDAIKTHSASLVRRGERSWLLQMLMENRNMKSGWRNSNISATNT
jgi:hypothetical protein